MESIFNKIDSLINKIDSKFINLWDCASNKSEYEYFDFFTAIEQLIELLKQHNLVKHYNDKLVAYRNALNDLFESIVKTTFSEVVALNDTTCQVIVKYTIVLEDTVGVEVKEKTINIEENQYKSLYKGKSLNELNPDPQKPLSCISRYSLLRNQCKSETNLSESIEQWSDEKDISHLFYQLTLNDLHKEFYSGFFEQYVKKLKKQHENFKAEDTTIKKAGNGLKSNLSKAQGIKLWSILKGNYIARETSKNNFAAIFLPESLPENFRTVEWIKKQNRNKKMLNKKAVFDLLKLTGVNLNETDLPTINHLICGTLSHSNWNGNKGNKTESEFATELKNIISQL